MPSPRWRKRWKALRRARSPIMLSLNLPQILIPPHADHRGSGGRIKRRPALPKRAALNRRDHAKITSPAQRRQRPKRSISAGISVSADLMPGLAGNLRAGADGALEIRWIRRPTRPEQPQPRRARIERFTKRRKGRKGRPPLSIQLPRDRWASGAD